MDNIWRPYLDNENDENGKQKEKKNYNQYCKTCKTIILNCYHFFSNSDVDDPITQTCDATKVGRRTLYRIRSNGPNSPKSRRNFRVKGERVDSFTVDLIRRTVYKCYEMRVAPTVDMIYEKLKDEIPYHRTSLYWILRKIGFRYCRTSGRNVIMESARLVRWRYYNYLIP